ncbi:MAG TPA: DinB family protein [Chloroflexia bacterium]|nr:DinB family protein [Chloroflexia bacterium]
MTDKEVLIDLLNELGTGVRDEIGEMGAEELAWQPDPRANSVGVTVWHVARWLDVLAARILHTGADVDELWHARGWAVKTGYDPRGIGASGLGNVTGYTLEEVAAIPGMSATDLLAYLDSTIQAVNSRIAEMPEGALYAKVPGLGKSRTAYGWIKLLLKGGMGHLGEIETLKAMRERRSVAV